jgi:hypothetical protein
MAGLTYGLETDIDAAWMKATNLAAPPCFACEIQLRYFGTLRGRLGYAAGQALPYITAGLAYGSVRISAPLIATSQSDTGIGWTARRRTGIRRGRPLVGQGRVSLLRARQFKGGVLSCGAETAVSSRAIWSAVAQLSVLV